MTGIKERALSLLSVFYRARIRRSFVRHGALRRTDAIYVHLYTSISRRVNVGFYVPQRFTAAAIYDAQRGRCESLSMSVKPT